MFSKNIIWVLLPVLILVGCTKSPDESSALWEISTGEKTLAQYKSPQKLIAAVLERSLVIQHVENPDLITLRISLEKGRKMPRNINLSSDFGGNNITIKRNNDIIFRSVSGLVEIDNFHFRNKERPFARGRVDAKGLSGETFKGSFTILIDKDLSWK